MPTSKRSRFLRALSIPVLFCAAAIFLVTIQAAIQRQTERARAAPPQVSQSDASQGDAVNPLASVVDLSEAADQGDVAAKLEMGRRFAQGRDIEKNDGKALSYFRGIVTEYQNIGAHDQRSPYVASAFVELARLYKKGVSEDNVAPDLAQAFGFLHHAASYFGDPVAQFEMAKLLLHGEGVTRNARAGAQWLLSAARKGYAPAQALLGDLLWRGDEGIKRVAGDGLGLLAIASRNATAEDKPWIGKLFEDARSQAQPIEILEANAFIVQELKTPHSAVTSNLLINGHRQSELSEAEGALVTQHGAAISGKSRALSELGSMSMSGASGTPASEEDGSAAGIIQMYKPRSPEGRLEPLEKMRIANFGE